jgi:hypothetical protein
VVNVSEGVVRDQVFRLVDLALVDTVIRKLRFENCLIVGPAVAVPLGGGSMLNCRFDGEPEAILWDFPVDVTKIGAIGLEECDFVECAFQGVGFAGPPEFHSIFRDSVSAQDGRQ